MAVLINQGRGLADAALPLAPGEAHPPFFQNGDRLDERLQRLTEIALQKEKQVALGALPLEEFIRGLERTALTEGLRLSPYAYRTISELFGSLGRLPEAIPFFRKLLATHPDDYHALNNLGVALVELARYAEARPYLERALRLKPNEAQICSNLGLVLRELKDFGEAARLLDRALDLDPSYAYAWINKGILLQEQGKLEDAVTAFSRGLALAPDNLERRPHLFGDGHLLLAQTFLELGRNAEALESAERAIEAGCQPALGRLFLANCLLALGNLEDAGQALIEFEKDSALITSDAPLRKAHADIRKELSEKLAQDERRFQETLEDINRRFPNALRRLAE